MATHITTKAGGLKQGQDYSPSPLTQLQCDMLKAAMRPDYSGPYVKRLVQLFQNRSLVPVELGSIRTRLRVQDTPSAACMALKHRIVTLEEIVDDFPGLQLMFSSLSDSEKEFLKAFYQCATERRTTENTRVIFILGNAAKGIDTANLANNYVMSIKKKSRDPGIGYCVDNRAQLAPLAYAVTERERGQHD